MKSESRTLKVKQLVNAPASEVYSAFTNATAFCEWLCNAAQADAYPGGRLYLWWNNGYYASGEFTRLEPGEKIAFFWHGRGEPGDTRVRIILKPVEEGTLVNLTHTDLGKGKAWKQIRKEFKKGWKRGLENLKSVLETGQDLRFVRRPLLGVTGLEEVSVEDAERLGLPAGAGLRLAGVVEGLGAHAAGLQRGDVLLKIAGQELKGYTALFNILGHYQAGDEVKVAFYRDEKRKKTKMKLSQRPLPEIPLSAQDLAQTVRPMHAQAYVDLEQCLEGVNKAEAEYKAQAPDWNVKEVLAHLIATERETHSWIAALVEGQGADFTFHGNLPARITATVSAFPSPANLLGELKRNLAETLAMLVVLPDEFVARKRSFWQLSYTLLNMPDHFQDHCAQIRTAVAAARGQSISEAPGDASPNPEQPIGAEAAGSSTTTPE